MNDLFVKSKHYQHYPLEALPQNLLTRSDKATTLTITQLNGIVLLGLF